MTWISSCSDSCSAIGVEGKNTGSSAGVCVPVAGVSGGEVRNTLVEKLSRIVGIFPAGPFSGDESGEMPVDRVATVVSAVWKVLDTEDSDFLVLDDDLRIFGLM